MSIIRFVRSIIVMALIYVLLSSSQAVCSSWSAVTGLPSEICLALYCLMIFLIMMNVPLRHGLRRRNSGAGIRGSEYYPVRRAKSPLAGYPAHLSPSEKYLLNCIRTFETVNTKELSCRMDRAESTIGNSIYRIRRKMGFSDRAELFAYAMMHISEESRGDEL